MGLLGKDTEFFNMEDIRMNGQTLSSRALKVKDKQQEVVVLRYDDGTENIVFANASMLFCKHCGERLGVKCTRGEDGAVVAKVRKPCAFPDGLTTTVRATFTSGRVVVADYLRHAEDRRDIHRRDDLEELDYNTVAGRSDYIKGMAEMNVLYAPVGNTCPTLYRRGDGSMVIASVNYEESLPDGWTALADICTDLWAATIADVEDYLARGGVPLDDQYAPEVVELEPGCYEMTYHADEASFVGPGFKDIDKAPVYPIIYADIARVGN